MCDWKDVSLKFPRNLDTERSCTAQFSSTRNVKVESRIIGTWNSYEMAAQLDLARELLLEWKLFWCYFYMNSMWLEETKERIKDAIVFCNDNDKIFF